MIGGILAAAATAAVSYPGRFYIAAAVLAIIAVVVWFTTAAPARQITAHAATDATDAVAHADATPAPKAKILTVAFGLILVVTFLTSAAFNAVVCIAAVRPTGRPKWPSHTPAMPRPYQRA